MTRSAKMNIWSKMLSLILIVLITCATVYWLYKLNTQYYPVNRTERVKLNPQPEDMTNYIGANER